MDDWKEKHINLTIDEVQKYSLEELKELKSYGEDFVGALEAAIIVREKNTE